MSDVIDTMESSGDFDEFMAEGSDDDLVMDIDDYESDNSEGIIQQDKLYKIILKLQFYIRTGRHGC